MPNKPITDICLWITHQPLTEENFKFWHHAQWILNPVDLNHDQNTPDRIFILTKTDHGGLHRKDTQVWAYIKDLGVITGSETPTAGHKVVTDTAYNNVSLNSGVSAMHHPWFGRTNNDVYLTYCLTNDPAEAITSIVLESIFVNRPEIYNASVANNFARSHEQSLGERTIEGLKYAHIKSNLDSGSAYHPAATHDVMKWIATAKSAPTSPDQSLSSPDLPETLPADLHYELSRGQIGINRLLVDSVLLETVAPDAHPGSGSISYSETVGVSETAEKSFTKELGATLSIEQSVSVEGAPLGIGASATTTIGLAISASLGWTTTNSWTTTRERTVTIEYQLDKIYSTKVVKAHRMLSLYDLFTGKQISALSQDTAFAPYYLNPSTGKWQLTRPA
ncbi:MAG: hypothetical protein HKN91_01505 [Acidimicrobiia bacterium]|nr:hypothetical protein [Acidimicrobiia bacterium]